MTYDVLQEICLIALSSIELKEMEKQVTKPSAHWLFNTAYEYLLHACLSPWS